MYEHIAILIELFVHIDCEKHSLRVLTPRETTKDKLGKHVSLKITSHRVNCVHLVFEPPSKCMHIDFDTIRKFTLRLVFMVHILNTYLMRFMHHEG